MPPNFLTKFARYSTTTPAPDQEPSPSRLPQLRNDTPRVILTSERDELPARPSSPGSIHRAHSIRNNGGTSTPGSESTTSKRSYSVSTDMNSSTAGFSSTTPRPSTAPSSSQPTERDYSIDIPRTTSPTEADFPPSSSLVADLISSKSTLKHKASSKSIRSDNVAAAPGTASSNNPNTDTSSPRSQEPQPPPLPIGSPITATTSTTSANTFSTSTSTSSTSQPRAATLAPDNSDAVSIRSTSAKKKPWKRNSLKQQKKLTGLAGAIAATGLAMANPGVTMQPLPSATLNSGTLTQSPPQSPPRTNTRRTNTDAIHGRPRQPSASHVSVTSRRSSTRTNATQANGNYQDDGSSYSDMSSDDEGELDLPDDIPVTGFAVASSKRNADFHDLFPAVPEGDYLIEDYGCALQREILIQGRLYVSENHLCFYANIFGWITNLIVPVHEITQIEKKMTAFVIPNAIQLTTRATKYTFASFLSRDTTYDVVINVWRLVRPDVDASGSIRSGKDEIDHGNVEVDEKSALAGDAPPVAGPGGDKFSARKPTTCACGLAKTHYPETPMETVFPGTPEQIYNLMFASGFIKEFMIEDQKLRELQISDWYKDSETQLLSRKFSYIKPLTASLGPKQAKCELVDQTVHCDFEDYVSTVTTTRTPDVPSGGVFSVKTRTCIMWASAVSSRVVVTSVVEWTGRSFIKSIIERSALDGQRSYHADLERAMRKYILQNRSEFVPEGYTEVDAVIPVAAEAEVQAILGQTTQAVDVNKIREQERNQRGLQWAWDTIMGAWKVAKHSTSGALDLISDAWDQSSSTTILIFVIVILVLSNIWALLRVGGRKAAYETKYRDRLGMAIVGAAESERLVRNVVAAVWEELSINHPVPQYPIRPGSETWKEEVSALNKALDAVDVRVADLRKALADLD